MVRLRIASRHKGLMSGQHSQTAEEYVASVILIIYGLRPAFGKSNPKTVVLFKTEAIGSRVF